MKQIDWMLLITTQQLDLEHSIKSFNFNKIKSFQLIKLID